METASATPLRNRTAPFYLPIGDETKIFRAAWQAGRAIMLKGPTGCGKTRLVEAMAHELGVALYTVPGHEDLTAADLVGRYTLQGGDTVWVDGPLTRAVREGAICYLDEIVEARQDTTVLIHPLTDHRRLLHMERQGGPPIEPAPGFCVVVSYNPGYQSVLKDLKMSTRQRMVAIDLGFPPADAEEEIITRETGVSRPDAVSLVRLGQAIRRLDNSGLKEVASTRTLVAAASLIVQGLPIDRAAMVAMATPLTDDPLLTDGLQELVNAYLLAER